MVKNILIKKEMLFREVKSSIFAYYFWNYETLFLDFTINHKSFWM